MEKWTQKQASDLAALREEVNELETAFDTFVQNSEKEHHRLEHEAMTLIQQQREVIQQLMTELDAERKDRRERRARAIARLKSE